MYRLLVVDDEPYILEGIADLFREFGELEVFKAESALDAMEWLNRTRIDIVLTDIQMPEMTGIDLLREIKKHWPRCKVIVLTGYNDFQFAQSAVRGGAIDYVLKTESDDQIVLTVDKALKLLEQEIEQDNLLQTARNHMVKAIPTLQKEYFLELLDGEPSTEASRRLRFQDLDIPLKPHIKVLLLLGRVDEWRNDLRPNDKDLLLYALNNIMEEFFSIQVVFVPIILQKDKIIWLLQPHAEDGGAADSTGGDSLWGRTIRYIYGHLESVQSYSKKYLRLPISFMIAGEPCCWEEVSPAFHRLRFQLSQGFGLDSEMILMDHPQEDGQEEEGRDPGSLQSQLLKRVHLLEHYLNSFRKKEFGELFDQIMSLAEGRDPVKNELAMEIFFSMASLFISYMNKRGCMNEMARKLDMRKLFSLEQHPSWEDTTSFFLELAGLLFERESLEYDHRAQEIVRKIDDYVMLHPERDLSLTSLAEQVYLTPAYLSRLYKKIKGMNVKDYIVEVRLQLAKELLSDTHLKIHEIGIRIGYESPPYFTRFFKKATEMTPQEYRDLHRKGQKG